MKKTSLLNRLKLEEGWFSLLALGLAFMTVVWSIEGARWTQGVSLLSRAAVVAFLLGFVLAKVRFVPGLLAHSFMISVGLVFVGVLVFPYVDARYANDDWTRKLGSIVIRVVKWGENGFSTYDPLVFLVSLALITWLVGYAATWLVFRRHRVWLAILVMGVMLTINLAYNPPNPFGSFSIFLISSLLLVVRFNSYMNEERWRRLRIPYSRKLWRGAMLVGASLVLLITAAAFAVPSSSQVEPLGQVLSNINGPWQQFQTGIVGFGSAPNLGPAREGRLPSNYNNLSKSFTIGGPITLSDEPLLKVKGDDPKYLQVSAMDLYDGKGWTATYQDGTPTSKNDKVFNQLSLAPGQSLPTSTDKGRAQYKLNVTPLVPNFNAVVTIGDLVTVDRASLLAYHWERLVINSPLDRINSKNISDGSNSSRSIIVDESSGQIIPPDLLPLVKLLKESQAKGGVSGPALPLSLTFNNGSYTASQSTNNRNSSTVKLQNVNGIDEYSFEVNGWVYKFPLETELKALNLPPGGNRDQSGRLQIRVIEKRLPEKVYTVPASNVYLSRDGIYTFVVNTNQINQGDAVRTRFEATDPGQKIKAEVERLTKEVPGNRISYDIRDGVPYSLNFDGYEPNYDDLLGANMQKPLEMGETFSTQGLRFRADEQSLRAAPKNNQSYPEWVRNRYLAVPTEVPQRVKDLALSLTADKNNPYDKAKAIEAYLRTIPYSLNAPYTPEGREVVDFFLFDSRLGYCVHYSTAFNVMMRSLGIPTREMTGFNGGEFDPATATTLIRANAYHAWSQAYFPGYGWVDFEPTPGRDEIARPLDPASIPPLPTPTPEPVATPAPVAAVPETPDEKLKPGQNNPVSEAEAAANRAVDEEKPNPALAWLFGMLGLVALCVLLYQANQWWLRSQLRLADVTPMSVYQRMLKSAQHAGLKPNSAMTPYEFSAFLGRKLPSVRGEVRAFTDGYVRQRYGPEAVEDELRRELAELTAARARIAEIEAEGREPTVQELWAAFKSQTILLHSSQQIREMWESYQLGLIAYRRSRRLRRMTPNGFRALHRRLAKPRHSIRRWRFRKKIS